MQAALHGMQGVSDRVLEAAAVCKPHHNVMRALQVAEQLRSVISRQIDAPAARTFFEGYCACNKDV